MITEFPDLPKEGFFHGPYTFLIGQYPTTLIESQRQKLGIPHGTDSYHMLALNLLSPTTGTGRTLTIPTRITADQHPDRLPTITAIQKATGWIRTAESEVINSNILRESAGTGSPWNIC